MYDTAFELENLQVTVLRIALAYENKTHTPMSIDRPCDCTRMAGVHTPAM